MNDLISRQWLMECVNEGWIKFDTEKDENRFIHLVRDIAPTAQPERKTGLWIEEHIDITDKEHPKSFRFYRCSACGHVAAPALFVGEKWLSYCPHCGAYMKGENDG